MEALVDLRDVEVDASLPVPERLGTLPRGWETPIGSPWAGWRCA